MRKHQYQGWSISTWAFWLALFGGGTFYGAYRFDWFPVGITSHSPALDEQAPAKPAVAANPPSQPPPDGRIEVAQSPAGSQSEPPPQSSMSRPRKRTPTPAL